MRHYLSLPSHQNQAPLGVTLNYLMEKVERILYQAALAISGAWRGGSSRPKLYEELGWETLSDHRMCRRILQIQVPGHILSQLFLTFKSFETEDSM